MPTTQFPGWTRYSGTPPGQYNVIVTATAGAEVVKQPVLFNVN